MKMIVNDDLLLALLLAGTLLAVGACKDDAATTEGPTGSGDKPTAGSGEFIPGEDKAEPDKKPAGAAEFKGAGEKLLKDKELEGYALSEGPDYYTKDTLFEIIDGASDGYIGYGMTEMAKTVYKPTGEFKEEINAEIYQFSPALGSMGKFSEERSNCIKTDEYAANWCLRKSDLLFWKGPYMVKVQTFDDTDAAENAVVAVAKAIDKKITASADLPGFFAKFPEEGRAVGTAGWRPRDQFGFSGLKNVYTHKYFPDTAYTDEENAVTLFGGELESEDAAKKLMESIKKSVGSNPKAKENGGAKDLAETGDEAFHYTDNYGTHTFLRKGKIVAGGRDFKDEKVAGELTKKLAAKL